jgi:hypothetical protein
MVASQLLGGWAVVMGYKRLSPAEKLKTLPARYTENVISWGLDWRTPIGQRVMSSLLTLAQDLGGWETLSRMEQILVERVTFMSLKVSEYETAKLTGIKPDLDDGTYSNHVNVLKGYLKDLGLKRRARPALDLQQYLAADETANG